MMTPPIFTAISNNAAVTNLLGTNPVRFFMFGMAPDNVQYPYAVWQVVSGSPENYLNNRPQIENHVIQIDVYSNSAATSRDILSKIECALEDKCHVVRYGGESRDPETKNYNSSMDVEWWVNR